MERVCNNFACHHGLLNEVLLQIWSRPSPPTPRTLAEIAQAERREQQARQNFKTQKISMMRKLWVANPDARQHIHVDSEGVPLYDENIHGRYVTLVTKLKKGDGLEELETW